MPTTVQLNPVPKCHFFEKHIERWTGPTAVVCAHTAPLASPHTARVPSRLTRFLLWKDSTSLRKVLPRTRKDVIYVRAYARTYAYRHVSTWVRTWIRTYARTYAYSHVLMYVRGYVRGCLSAFSGGLFGGMFVPSRSARAEAGPALGHVDSRPSGGPVAWGVAISGRLFGTFLKGIRFGNLFRLYRGRHREVADNLLVFISRPHAAALQKTRPRCFHKSSDRR